jgi:hypothetical protein
MLQQVGEDLVIALQGFVKRIKFEIVLEALLNLNEVEALIDRRGSGGSRVPEQKNATIAEPVGEKNYRKHDDENTSEHLYQSRVRRTLSTIPAMTSLSLANPG